MATIKHEIETLYDRGDVVVFDHHGILRVGIISGFYADADAGMSIWYDIAVNKDQTLDYVHGGDIAEFNILGRINDPKVVEKVFGFVQSGDIPDDDTDDEADEESSTSEEDTTSDTPIDSLRRQYPWL